MPRVSNSKSRSYHKKLLSTTKSFLGRSKNCFRIAKLKATKSLLYSYRDRRNRKRNFRKLWIQRANSALRAQNLKYSQLVYKLDETNVALNRNSLANIITRDNSFVYFMINKN